MPRLFVAIDLPGSVTAALAAVQPPPVRGVKPVEPAQMHLTLHFLGDAELDGTAAALREVVAPQIRLKIGKLGRFNARDGSAVLWAGVTTTEELLTLYARTGAALALTGFRPETRPYRPHLTLARCRPGAPSAVIADFLQREGELSIPEVLVTRFSLYSSELTPAGPIYRREALFVLGE